MTLKEQQAIEKRQRLAIERTCNYLLSRFSLKEIKVWGDVYRVSGYNDNWIKSQPNANSTLTYPELKQYCEKFRENFEQQLKAKYDKKQDVVDAKVAESSDKKVVGEGVWEDKKPSVFQSASTEASAIQSEVVQPPNTIPATKAEPLDESGSLNDDDYGLQPSPREKAFLYWFQKKATKELWNKIVVRKLPCVMLLSGTGTGKTFIQGALDRRLKDIKFADSKTWGHINTLAITRKSVVTQTKRVLQNHFNINPILETEVINIERLRTRAGQIWVKSKTEIVDGEEVIKWEWTPMINPSVLFIDECQAVKNASSTQHKILLAYSNLENTTQIYISATPFSRVCEAKAFAIATKKDISEWTGIPGSTLSEATWPSYAAAIAHPSAPDEYNEAACGRLRKDLNDYIVNVRKPRWQFNEINTVKIIDFENPEQRKEYNDAWERYLEKKAKLHEIITTNEWFLAAIELNIFLAAAEYCKRDIFAKRMYRDVQEGYAAVCAMKFKRTINATTKILVEKYGVPRDQISLIYGGGQTQLTAKQKLKAQVRANQETFDKAGISLEDMMLEDVEDRTIEVFDPNLRLGIQSLKQRQEEIDRFQSGKSLYCIYSYKAGGVGLSLHHTDEMTKEKVRHHKNGYAYVEDIPKIPTRPRKVTIGPVFSPIELVQGCGRVPRLSSLSDTIQEFLYFRGTKEQYQAAVVSHRLKCLSKVVSQPESWLDLITNHEKAEELSRKYIEIYKPLESDEPQNADINIVAPEKEDEDGREDEEEDK